MERYWEVKKNEKQKPDTIGLVLKQVTHLTTNAIQTAIETSITPNFGDVIIYISDYSDLKVYDKYFHKFLISSEEEEN